MGLFSIVICIIALVLSRGKTIFTPAIIILILNIWSYGVMYNFRDNPEAAPNFWTVINFLSTIAAVILIILSFVFK